MTNQSNDITQTQPLPEGPATGSLKSEYLFIERMEVVGTVAACCAICAWKEGHPKWPDALMACWTGEVKITEQCVHKSRERRGIPFFRPADLTERITMRGKQN